MKLILVAIALLYNFSTPSAFAQELDRASPKEAENSTTENIPKYRVSFEKFSEHFQQDLTSLPIKDRYSFARKFLPESELYRLFIDKNQLSSFSRPVPKHLYFDLEEPGYYAAMVKAFQYFGDHFHEKITLSEIVRLHDLAVDHVKRANTQNTHFDCDFTQGICSHELMYYPILKGSITQEARRDWKTYHFLGEVDGEPPRDEETRKAYILKERDAIWDTTPFDSAHGNLAILYTENKSRLHMQSVYSSLQWRIAYFKSYFSLSNPNQVIPLNGSELSAQIVEMTLERYFRMYEFQIGNAENEDDKLAAISILLRALEIFHIFPDGNQRTVSFLLLNKLLLQNGFPLCILDDPNVFDGYLGTSELVAAIKTGISNFLKLAYQHPFAQNALSYEVLAKGNTSNFYSLNSLPELLNQTEEGQDFVSAVVTTENFSIFEKILPFLNSSMISLIKEATLYPSYSQIIIIKTQDKYSNHYKFTLYFPLSNEFQAKIKRQIPIQEILFKITLGKAIQDSNQPLIRSFISVGFDLSQAYFDSHLLSSYSTALVLHPDNHDLIQLLRSANPHAWEEECSLHFKIINGHFKKKGQQILNALPPLFDFSISGNSRMSCLLELLTFEQRVDFIRSELIEKQPHHIGDEIIDEHQNTLLHWSVKYKDVSLIETLIRNGAPLDKKNSDGLSSLDMARALSTGKNAKNPLNQLIAFHFGIAVQSCGLSFCPTF